MSKRILLCLFLLATAFSAHATDYTDIWYIPAESGWGANVVQSDISTTQSFMFVTFFIYGADNKPTWFSANLTLDATGNYNGPLYANTGTYYGAAWNASTAIQTQVGTASFQHTSPYTANLIYVVTSGPTAITITKAIQRQTLTLIGVGGVTYPGVASVTASGCSMAGSEVTDVDVTISQPVNNNGTMSIVLNYLSSGATCTFAGSAIQWGKLYQIPSATYVCANGFKSTVKIDELNATPHGLEFLWTAPITNGCTESGTFVGVFP
jgi:hypothetical protein